MELKFAKYVKGDDIDEVLIVPLWNWNEDVANYLRRKFQKF